MAADPHPNPIAPVVERAHQASLVLETLKGSDRNRGVLAMAEALEGALNDILEANTLDLEVSREMAVPDLVIDWLKLTPERLKRTCDTLRRLANLHDPLRRVMNAPYQLATSQTYCQPMPLGVVALIYEAFPELAAIAAGLCIKTGNSLILRGGSEGSHSNTLITQILQIALSDGGLPPGCVEFFPPDQGITVQDIVTQDQHINLVIPYGRPSLVQKVVKQSIAPVLRSAMGNCYLYWAPSGELELVRSLIIDSHASLPDPVNAVEKVLITPCHKASSLLRLFTSLQEKGFKLRGDGDLVAEYDEYLEPADPKEWNQPYLSHTIAFHLVENLGEAITWINQYSSGHADCIVTAAYDESRQFAMGVDSALVYVNASPRFSRNPQGGDCIFLGMSNQKGHRRGPIGLDTFTTLKQVVQGEGV